MRRCELPRGGTELTGRSIPVVHLLWEQTDWVQFPAARHKITIRASLESGALIVIMFIVAGN